MVAGRVGGAKLQHLKCQGPYAACGHHSCSSISDVVWGGWGCIMYAKVGGAKLLGLCSVGWEREGSRCNSVGGEGECVQHLKGQGAGSGRHSCNSVSAVVWGGRGGGVA